MTTIRDVARAADVSVATVSRFINNKGNVSPKAMQKIASAIEALDYRPNEIARSLYQKQTNMIGLIIPDIANPFFPMLARGVEDYLVEHNYQMILGNGANDCQRETQYFETFQQHNCAGIISTSLPCATNRHLPPTILVDRQYDSDIPFVSANHQQAGQLIAKKVSKTNPKGVLLMIGPKELRTVHDKNKAIIDYFNQHQIAFTSLEVASFGLASIRQIVYQVFKRIDKFDTIIATNDLHAMYIIQEAHSRGIEIPQELQIIGYDGIDFAELSIPRLATIRQPVYQMGSLAAELLLTKIQEPRKEIPSTLLSVDYQEGDTLRKDEKK